MAKDNFTTGMVASVWQVRKPDQGRTPSQMRLVEIEHRLDHARKILEKIEKRAREAEQKTSQAERRFESLKDSFELLRQEWQEWKKNEDEE